MKQSLFLREKEEIVAQIKEVWYEDRIVRTGVFRYDKPHKNNLMSVLRMLPDRVVPSVDRCLGNFHAAV